MFKEIFFAFWFFGPVGLANVSAFFSSKISYLKKLNYPVDLKINFRKKRLLGSHKTIRGFVFGIFMAIIGVYFQVFMFKNFSFMRQILTIDYSAINPISFGFLCGFGALAGDAVKSFFKRQVGVPSGEPWLVFDQVDYIIGGLLFTFWYAPLTLEQYVYVLVVYVLLHLFINVVGYFLGLKKDPI